MCSIALCNAGMQEVRKVWKAAGTSPVVEAHWTAESFARSVEAATLDAYNHAVPGCIATTHHSFRGSFSAVSTPIFATKYSFSSIFQDLQDLLTSASRESQKVANICLAFRDFEGNLKFHKIKKCQNEREQFQPDFFESFYLIYWNRLTSPR